MSFLGLFSTREVENIKRLAYEDGVRHTKVECNKEKNKLINEFEEKIKKLNKESIVLDVKNIKLEKYNKKIRKLEEISKKTKKYRLKKKCENKILIYKMRKIDFE